MKKKVALVTGGYSGEAAISYKSAVTFYNNLKNRFDIYTIDITPKGWFYADEKGNKTEIDKNDFSLQIKGQKVTFDVIFIGHNIYLKTIKLNLRKFKTCFLIKVNKF